MTACRGTKQHPLVATAVLDAVAVLPVEEPAGGASLGGALASMGPAAKGVGPAAVAIGAAGMESAPMGAGAAAARVAARAVAMQGVVWLATALARAWALPPAGRTNPECKNLTGQPTLDLSWQARNGSVSGMARPDWMNGRAGVTLQGVRGSIVPRACQLAAGHTHTHRAHVPPLTTRHNHTHRARIPLLTTGHTHTHRAHVPPHDKWAHSNP